MLSPTIRVGNPDTGIDPGFVDIKSATVFMKDLKSQGNNLLKFIDVS